jgi:phosphoribosylformylglycinamidine (FGAM) synthase-like enzyme
MQAGGIGYGKLDQVSKKTTNRDKIVILGGRNYRIGMGEQPFHQQIQELLAPVLS